MVAIWLDGFSPLQSNDYGWLISAPATVTGTADPANGTPQHFRDNLNLSLNLSKNNCSILVLPSDLVKDRPLVWSFKHICINLKKAQSQPHSLFLPQNYF
jgi:hypothetical protein